MTYPKIWKLWPFIPLKYAVVIQWERSGPYMLVEPDGTTSERIRPPTWSYFKRVK